jgi:hypothetical protein
MFTYQNKSVDVVGHHLIDDVAFEIHDIIVQSVVPFPDKFQNCKAIPIICIENFKIQGIGTHKIPGRVYIVVVNAFRIHIVVVLLAKKWRKLIFRGIVVL